MTDPSRPPADATPNAAAKPAKASKPRPTPQPAITSQPPPRHPPPPPKSPPAAPHLFKVPSDSNIAAFRPAPLTMPPDLPPIPIPPRPSANLAAMFSDDTAYTITLANTTASASATPPHSPPSTRAHGTTARHASPTPSPVFPTAPLSAVSFTEYVTSEFVLSEDTPRFSLAFKPPKSPSPKAPATTAGPASPHHTQAAPQSLSSSKEGVGGSTGLPTASSPKLHHADLLQPPPPPVTAPAPAAEPTLHRSETLPNIASAYTSPEDDDGIARASTAALRTHSDIPQAPATAHAPSRSRWGKLDMLQVDTEGVVTQLSLTRAEILHEARSVTQIPTTQQPDKWMGTPTVSSDATTTAAAWKDFSGVGGDAQQPMSSPRLDGRRRAAQKALRDYLRNSLQARDIRQVDPAFVAKPALWVRHSAIVVSLEGLRAIILHNKMFLFDPSRSETKQLLLVAQKCIVSNPDADNPQSFEFNALEGILIFLAMRLEREFNTLKPEIDTYLHQLPNELTTKMLEELRRKKQQLNHFHSRASSVKTILENLLDEDEEMANMYLTEKQAGENMHRDCHDHSEIETLLEAYLQVIDEHVNHATLLHDAIDDTEDLVMIHLDTLRNRLLSVELTLSVVSMMFGVGGVIAGVFGMNLTIPLFDAEASPLWFLFVVLVILLTVVVVSWLVLVSLRRRGLYSPN